MQRAISNKVFPGQTVSPYEDAGHSSAIGRTASNYNDAKEKVKKNKGTDQHWKIWRGHCKIYPWPSRA